MTPLGLLHAGLGLVLLVAATLKRAEVATWALTNPNTTRAAWTLFQCGGEWVGGA